MINQKEKLISKIVKKNYNSRLEEVLSKKSYKEEVKNNLLDILYKIEVAYKDYSKVKVNVLSEEEYMQNIIDAIKNKCEIIRFVRPNIKEDVELGNRTFNINSKKKEIVCYPIIRKLLYCISKIQKKENIVDVENELINHALTTTLNVGNCINTVEPLRDFNGFSWDISTKEIENLYYNLIYQDLIILKGNQFFEEWTNNPQKLVDYMELLKSSLDESYGEKNSKKIIELIKKISMLLQIQIDKNFAEKSLRKNTEIAHELEHFENKEEYIVMLGNKKKELAKKVRNIDILINDRNMLSEEYKRRNLNVPLEDKIFSVRVLINQIEKEREEFLAEIEKCNKLMNPKEFIRSRNELKEQYKYSSLVETEDYEKEILNSIVSLQKEVLKCFKIKIKDSKTKQDIEKVMYELRYFNLLPVTEEKNIKDIETLQKSLEEVKKEVIKRAVDLKLINQIFNDIEQNDNVLINIFGLKIISLEDINIKITKEKDDFFVQFFDENTIEEKFKIDIFIKKEDLKIKLNKKIKLFA